MKNNTKKLIACYLMPFGDLLAMLFAASIYGALRHFGVKIDGYWVLIFYVMIQGSVNYYYCKN